VKRSGESNAKGGKPTAQGGKSSPASAKPKVKAQITIPAKMAAAIERKLRQEKLSRTDYFIRLALKDLFDHDPQAKPKQPPESSDGAG